MPALIVSGAAAPPAMRILKRPSRSPRISESCTPCRTSAILIGSLLNFLLFGTLVIQVYVHNACFPRDRPAIKWLAPIPVHSSAVPPFDTRAPAPHSLYSLHHDGGLHLRERGGDGAQRERARLTRSRPRRVHSVDEGVGGGRRRKDTIHRPPGPGPSAPRCTCHPARRRPSPLDSADLHQDDGSEGGRASEKPIEHAHSWYAAGFGDLVKFGQPRFSPFYPPLLGSVIALAAQPPVCHPITVPRHGGARSWPCTTTRAQSSFTCVPPATHLSGSDTFISTCYSPTAPPYIFYTPVARRRCRIGHHDRGDDDLLGGGAPDARGVLRLVIETSTFSGGATSLLVVNIYFEHATSIAIIGLALCAGMPTTDYFLCRMMILPGIYANTLLALNNRAAPSRSRAQGRAEQLGLEREARPQRRGADCGRGGRWDARASLDLARDLGDVQNHPYGAGTYTSWR
ncbi:hypothetical protein FB451DRAFT_1409904 [Mycena latifolia]|nr:hypothetical protein FB451DRAFT_1409904 [Mycena latifolia]